MPPVQTLIVDDNPRSRAGLRALLTTCPQIQVVGEASDGGDAERQIEQHRPDVVLMDARMPNVDGLTALRRIKQRWPHLRVVMLSLYPGYRGEAEKSGAAAFLVKGCTLEQLLDAILPGGSRPPS